MSGKDKILFGLIVILILGGGYIQYSYSQITQQMKVLASGQMFDNHSLENPIIDTHVQEVNEDFREDLRKLELQFIGRGKHLQQAQKDIIANTELIKAMTDSLSRMIGDVQFNLEEFSRDTRKELGNLSRDQRELQDSFDSYRRRITRQLSDIEQSVASIRNDIAGINEKLLEKKK